MATAAKEGRVTARERENGLGRVVYRCPCTHSLRVSGGGRHRVYFECENTRLDDPVMNRVCPSCGRSLPGKNAP